VANFKSPALAAGPNTLGLQKERSSSTKPILGAIIPEEAKPEAVVPSQFLAPQKYPKRLKLKR
jgi:hypothetical protein